MISFERRRALKIQRRQEANRLTAAEGLLSIASGLSSDSTATEPAHLPDTCMPGPSTPVTLETSKTIGTQTDLTTSDIASIEKECQQLRTDNSTLKDLVMNITVDEKSFENNDEKVKLYTGLPSYAVLIAIFMHISVCLKASPKMTAFGQFIMTLMRLRLNLNVGYLAHCFNVHVSTVSRVFHNVINILDSKLVPALIHWPEREALRLTLPNCFRCSFPKCVCIIDCFELFIEKPSDLKARAQTYSNYKSHNTIKYLIGITPQGTISFISKGWGGRASDKCVTENSGFLSKLLPGDVVLADRGFDIADLLGLYADLLGLYLLGLYYIYLDYMLQNIV